MSTDKSRRNDVVGAVAGILGGVGAALILLATGVEIGHSQQVDPAFGFIFGAVLLAFATGITVTLLVE